MEYASGHNSFKFLFVVAFFYQRASAERRAADAP